MSMHQVAHERLKRELDHTAVTFGENRTKYGLLLRIASESARKCSEHTGEVALVRYRRPSTQRRRDVHSRLAYCWQMLQNQYAQQLVDGSAETRS